MINRVDVKIVMLGDKAVGKTSILERYVNERFNESAEYRSTIGTAFAAKKIVINDKQLVLGLWDTAGCERFRSMVSVYYRGAKAAIICYDICDQMAFNRAKSWVRELRSREEECKIYICATKCDKLQLGCEPMPCLDTVRVYVNGIQGKLFITSSKTGENIAKLFQEIAKDYLSNPKNQVKSDENVVDLALTSNKKKTCCVSFRH